MNLPYCILADAVKGEMEAVKTNIQVNRAQRTVPTVVTKFSQNEISRNFVKQK